MNTARTIRRGITVMATAVLCVVVVLPAYAAYEDSLKGYWKMDDMSYDDDFSGSSINSNGWLALGGGGGMTPYISSGELVLKNPTAGSSSVSYITSESKFSFSGDFDIQYNWHAATLPDSPNGNVMRLNFYVNGSNSAYTDYWKQPGLDFYRGAAYVNGAWHYADVNRESETAASFRLQRTGSTIKSYYISQSGGDWNLLYSYNGFPTSDGYIQMALYSINSCPANEVHIDNLTVTNGEPVADAAGSNPGKIYSATQTAGQFDNALNFNGTSGYVDLGTNTLTNGATTLSYWFNYNGTGNAYIGDLKIVQPNGVFIGSTDTGTSFGIRGAGITPYASYDLSGWTNIALVYNGLGAGTLSNYEIYVNGVNSAIGDGGANGVGWSKNVIGAVNGGTNTFNGSIDDFSIWDRALDANEISMIYEMGTEKFEWLTLGVNDANKLNLGYTTSELKLLADLYAEGNAGASENIDGLTWHYLSGDLPGDIGGTTYDYGDTWTYDGRSYIKLGSGLEGSPIPEPGCAFGLLVGFFVPGLRKVLKRKVRS